MKIIPLTQGQFTIVDDDVFEWASKVKWTAQKHRNTFYAVRKTPLENGKRAVQQLHREILNAPPGVPVDHIDGNGLRNLGNNIRLCSPAENCQNSAKRRDNTSGYKGVHFDRRRDHWHARVAEAIGVIVRINAVPFLWCKPTASYEDIMGAIGKDPKQVYTMTYCYGQSPAQNWGCLWPGKAAIPVEDGMMFNAYDTSNA